MPADIAVARPNEQQIQSQQLHVVTEQCLFSLDQGSHTENFAKHRPPKHCPFVPGASRCLLLIVSGHALSFFPERLNQLKRNHTFENQETIVLKRVFLFLRQHSVPFCPSKTLVRPQTNFVDQTQNFTRAKPLVGYSYPDLPDLVLQQRRR